MLVPVLVPVLVLVLVLAPAPRTLADDCRYVASRQVLLGFASGNGSPVDAVELRVTSDGGQTWRVEPAERVGARTLRYTVPGDGRYGFYLILKNAAGASAEPPKAGSAPHVRVVVDTVGPTLQLHGASVAGENLGLRATLVDENLGQAGVRVFYRTSGSTAWKDGGIAAHGDGQITWRIPASFAGAGDIRVVATDLAGNRATDELRGLAINSTQPSPKLEDRPQADFGVPVGDLDELDASAVAPVPPARVESASALDSKDESPTEVPGTEPNPRTAESLRRMALRFMNERRYALATARLEDALKLAPEDADLLVDLGTALYRSGQLDAADARFDAALKVLPEHARALDGLALVDATQKRYPQAREHLLQLLRLTPESPETWLRLGDIEHKLGEVDRAREAWQRVLKLRDADGALREKAEKRLRYFRPADGPVKP